MSETLQPLTPLLALRTYDECQRPGRPWPHDWLKRQTGREPGACLMMVQTLIARGFIEGTARHGVLSAKGRAVLARADAGEVVEVDLAEPAATAE